MLGNLSGWHLLLVLAIALLLFGATRLPALAKSLGQSLRIIRAETGDALGDNPGGDSMSPKKPAV